MDPMLWMRSRASGYAHLRPRTSYALLTTPQRLFGFAQIFAFSLTFMSTWEGMCTYGSQCYLLPYADTD